MDFPYEIEKPGDSVMKQWTSDFQGQRDGFVQVGPKKWLLPKKYLEFAETIYNFRARSDDVYVCTFPRSGTTWAQEMIWLICNDLDFETAMKTPLLQRFPFFEFNILLNEDTKEKAKKELKQAEAAMLEEIRKPIFDKLNTQTSRRFIKTHISLDLMPRNIKEVGAKIVYVARNPQDVAVSYYHLQKQLAFGFTGDFERFLDYMMDDLIVFGPYWQHVLEGWNRRNDRNVHFIFYEDLKFDLENSLKKLALFLEHSLDKEDLPKLLNHLHFDSFQQNGSIMIPSLRNFVRRGKVGGNPEVTEEIAKKIDEWTKKNLGETDLTFTSSVV